MKNWKLECKSLRADIEAALAEVAKKHNTVLTIGTMTYNVEQDEITCSLKFSQIPDGVTAENKAAAAEAIAKATFDKYAQLFGGEKEWFGQRIVLNGELYKITGLNTKARKNAFFITSLKSGKEYVTDASAIKDGITTYQSTVGKQR